MATFHLYEHSASNKMVVRPRMRQKLLLSGFSSQHFKQTLAPIRPFSTTVLFSTQLAMFLIMVAATAYAKTPEDVFARASPSVVVVDVLNSDRKPVGLGSGVVIAPGLVITNCHVVNKGPIIRVRRGNHAYIGSLDLSDAERDLCQLRVLELTAPPATLGTAKSLKVGQRVYAIGSPKGLELSIAEGLVSSLREFEGSFYIQTSAPISQGSSGGGLFDDQGRLVGITTFYLKDGQNLNFALPVDFIGGIPKRVQAKRMRSKDPQESQRPLDWLNQALLLQAKADWHGLLEHCGRWTRTRPEDVAAWIALGRAQLGLGDYRAAIDGMRGGLKRHPGFAGLWHNLGVAHASLAEYDIAIQALEEALRLQSDAKTNRLLAWLLVQTRKYEEAVVAARQALRLAPDSQLAWEVLGDAYTGLGRHDDAVWAYEEEVRANGNDSRAWYKLAVAAGNAKRYQVLHDALGKVLALDPNHAEAWYLWGILWCNTVTVEGNRILVKRPDPGARDEIRKAYEKLRELDHPKAKWLFDKCVTP